MLIRHRHKLEDQLFVEVVSLFLETVDENASRGCDYIQNLSDAVLYLDKNNSLSKQRIQKLAKTAHTKYICNVDDQKKLRLKKLAGIK